MRQTNQQLPITRLSKGVKKFFQESCEKLILLPGTPSAKDLVNESRKLSNIFKKDTKVLHAVKNLAAGKVPFIILENIPIDSILCQPPNNGLRPMDKYNWTSEMSLLALTCLAGLEPMSYLEEKGLELIHQVAPTANMQETRSNGGIIPLDWHTDNSILTEEYRLEMLGLLSLVNDSNTATSISVVANALELLSPRHRQTLHDALYRVKTPDSFDRAFGNKKILSEWRPIIKRMPTGELIAAANLFYTESKNDAAQTALRALNEALLEVADEIVLTPGMCLLFNNNAVFHSRGAIEGARWLQRVFAKKSLDGLRKASHATANDYIFSVKPLIF